MSGDLCCTWPNCAHTAKDQCRWAEDAVIRKQAHIAARSVDADEITRLRAEVERLRGEWANNPLTHQLMAHADAGWAEVARLRAALARIASDDEADADLNEYGPSAVAHAAQEEKP